MSDFLDNPFLWGFAVVGTICVAAVLIVREDNRYHTQQEQQIAEAIRGGADPMLARCAIRLTLSIDERMLCSMRVGQRAPQ